MTTPDRVLAVFARAEARALTPSTFRIGTATATLVALALGAATLGREPLWRDELLSTSIASMPLGDFVDSATGQQNGLLFHVVLWLDVHVLDTGALAVRLPALLAYAGAVLLCALVGRRLAGPAVGVAAAALLALNPFALAYGQEARPYGFVLLFSLAAVMALLRAIEQPRARRWIAYVAALALLGYSHDFAVLSVLAHPVLVLARGDRTARLRFALSIVVPALALAPLLVLVPSGWSSLAFIWIDFYPGLAREIATTFAGGTVGLVLCALILIAGAAALLAARRSGRPLAVPADVPAFLAVWLIGPFLVLYVVSIAQPVLVDRYLVQSLPALCLAIAVAAASLPRPVAALGVAAIGAVFLTTSIRDSVSITKEDWRAASSYATGTAQPDEAIIALGDAGAVALGLAYYAPPGRRLADPWWAAASHDPSASRVLAADGRFEGRSLREALAGRAGFVLVRAGFVSPAVEQVLRTALARCDVQDQRRFTGKILALHAANCA